MTIGPEVRFRTVTRTRHLARSEAEQRAHLRDLYADNLERLFKALAFCDERDIRLYRMTSGPFPMCDYPVGAAVLDEFRGRMKSFGTRARKLGIRVIQHPDQFVVLSSLTDTVVQQSIQIMQKHADVFDRLGLPRSTWSAMILHGGKSGRTEALVKVIKQLPATVRKRLVLENDEYAYSAEEILEVCRLAKVPMVFDPHHHVVKEKLDSYEHPSIARMLKAAAATWPKPDWQVVHLSNGRTSFADPRHSELITTVPSALCDAPWVEVEAKGKEEAIAHLRTIWPIAC